LGFKSSSQTKEGLRKGEGLIKGFPKKGFWGRNWGKFLDLGGPLTREGLG